MPDDLHTQPGKVYLVGAGPGDPELITVRGVKTLALADLVLYDYLVNAELLAHARPDAQLVGLGQAHGGRGMTQEEVNQRMVAAARAGKTVVRLKGGDPNLFGRGAEEIAALTAAEIEYEVVPGVTAALAAASHAGISLTHRDYASAVALVTGHQRSDKAPLELDYNALARFPGTLVFYMGVTTVRQWSEALNRLWTIGRRGGDDCAAGDVARSGGHSLHAGHGSRYDRTGPHAPAGGDYCRRRGRVIY